MVEKSALMEEVFFTLKSVFFIKTHMSCVFIKTHMSCVLVSAGFLFCFVLFFCLLLQLLGYHEDGEGIA